MTRESALAKLIGILRHDDVNLNPLAWNLEDMLKEPKAYLPDMPNPPNHDLDHDHDGEIEMESVMK